MNRKTLTAVAAFAILGLVAFFALRQPEKGENATDRARPLPPIAVGSLDTIDITRQGVTSTLKREGGKYKVTAPVAAAADETNAKAAFEALEKLTLGNVVTENKASTPSSRSMTPRPSTSSPRRAQPPRPTSSWARP
jgi:hypothetical protein